MEHLPSLCPLLVPLLSPGPNSLLGPGASGAAGGGVVVPSLASMPSLSDPVAHLSAAGALGLLAGPGGRPESPATKDGRGHKKYRRCGTQDVQGGEGSV